MFEEFGKKLTKEQRNSAMKKSLRDPVYQATYAAADQAVSNSSYYMGTLFWRQGYFLYNTNQDTYDVLVSGGAGKSWGRVKDWCRAQHLGYLGS